MDSKLIDQAPSIVFYFDRELRIQMNCSRRRFGASVCALLAERIRVESVLAYLTTDRPPTDNVNSTDKPKQTTEK